MIILAVFWQVCLPGLANEPARPAGLSLWLPQANWGLVIEAEGFRASERQLAPDGNSIRLIAEDRLTGVMVSAFIEPAGTLGEDSEYKETDNQALAAREFFLRRHANTPERLVELLRWHTDEFAFARHMIRLADHPDFVQHHLNVYAARGNHWVDVHFSMMGHEAPEKLRLLARSVRIVEPYTPTHEDRQSVLDPLLLMDNLLIARADMTPAAWRETMMEVVTGYVQLGELTRARDLLQEGIRRFNDQAMFYYQLAAVEARLGNSNVAISNLRQAWGRRSSLPRGEQLPNPLSDPSFAELIKDPVMRRSIELIFQP